MRSSQKPPQRISDKPEKDSGFITLSMTLSGGDAGTRARVSQWIIDEMYRRAKQFGLQGGYTRDEEETE